MSRTYKHIKQVKLKKFYIERWSNLYDEYKYETTYSGWADYEVDTGKVYTRVTYLKKAGVSPKLQKRKDTEDRWMTTPGWWISLTMTKPERRSAKVALTKLDNIEEIDIPDLGRKPHIYFW